MLISAQYRPLDNTTFVKARESAVFPWKVTLIGHLAVFEMSLHAAFGGTARFSPY
jgi:hypothetical protein